MTCKFLNFTLAGYVIAAAETQAGDGASFFEKRFLELCVYVGWSGGTWLVARGRVILSPEEVKKDMLE